MATTQVGPAAADAQKREMTEAGTVELISMRYDTSIGSEVRQLKVTIGESSKLFYHFF